MNELIKAMSELINKSQAREIATDAQGRGGGLTSSGPLQRGDSSEKARSVLFVSHTDEWIGPNISLLELVTRLPQSYEAHVAVAGRGPFSEELNQRGIRVHRFTRLDKWGIPALVRTIRREAISLVYGNSASSVSRSALVAARICRLPFIIHLREIASNSGWRTRLLLSADQVIAVSRATAASYSPILSRPPVIVYNGVAVEKFRLDRKQCRMRLHQDHGIPADALLIVHVGNVYERKGQLLAIQAMEAIVRRQPDVRLLLIGRLDRDPTYVKAVRSLISTAGLDHRVNLVGLRHDVTPYLGGADVFVHTATRDPHPRAVIEAMAAALPVVALAVDGVAESVIDGQTGYLMPAGVLSDGLAGAVLRLLEDPDLRTRLGHQGQVRVAKVFSAGKTAHDVVEVMNQLVSRC